MFDALISAIGALVDFVRKSKEITLDESGFGELQRLDAQVYAFSQLAGLSIPETRTSPKSPFHPFGHTWIPSLPSRGGLDATGQERPGGFHVCPTLDWQQAMLGLRATAEAAKARATPSIPRGTEHGAPMPDATSQVNEGDESTHSPSSGSQPDPPLYTLRQLIQDLEGSEWAYQANLRTALRKEIESPFEAPWSHAVAAALRFQPDPARMPGVRRIEVWCDREFAGTGLTAANVRQLRAKLCQSLQWPPEQVDTLTLEEAADALEGKRRVPFEVFTGVLNEMLASPYLAIDRILDLNLDIVKADCRIVPGTVPSVCPNASPSLPAEYLPTVVRAYRRVFPIPSAHTIHWVGLNAWRRNLCKCFETRPESFPPELLDPSRCPGCKTPVREEHRTLSKVSCPACGRWELNTGGEVMPAAGPPGTLPSVRQVASPCWQSRLPDRTPKHLAVPPVDQVATGHVAANNVGGERERGMKDAQDAGDGNGAAPVCREGLIQQMEPSVRLAYLAFCYAESRTGTRLEDREAYNLIKEESIPEGQGERGELDDYQLPAFDTWARYLREARNALGEQKYSRRRGRSAGKSIVRGDQIERLKDDDE